MTNALLRALNNGADFTWTRTSNDWWCNEVVDARQLGFWQRCRMAFGLREWPQPCRLNLRISITLTHTHPGAEKRLVISDVTPATDEQPALAVSPLARATRPLDPPSLLGEEWPLRVRCPDYPSPAKHPIPALAPRGVKHATTSTVTIRAWWTHAPLANPAFATGDVSRITVLDVDGDKGGFDSLKRLEAEHGKLPHTLRLLTASGEHIYFAYPGTHLKNTTGRLGPGLDIRCCGGYVVAVSATHRSGRTYAWKDGHAPGQAPLAEPPAWLYGPPKNTDLQPAIGKGYASAALASEEQQLLRTLARQRNQRLKLAAFRLARFIPTGALTEADIHDVLFAAAKRIGLPDKEAEATINSGLRAGART